jgi:hypothetical protein
MYERFSKKSEHSVEWIQIVKQFLNKAFADGHHVTKCSCTICRDYRFLTHDKVHIHLCQEVFMPNYLVWRDHGEAEELPIESDCYVYAAFSIVMHVLHFLYAGFWRLPSWGGRQNRQKNKKKSYVHQLTDVHNLCSSDGRVTYKFGYVPRLAEERKFVSVPWVWAEEHKVGYVPRFWAEKRKVGYFPRFWPRNVSSHMFLGLAPRNVSSDMFLGLCSSVPHD